LRRQIVDVETVVRYAGGVLGATRTVTGFDQVLQCQPSIARVVESEAFKRSDFLM